MKLPKEVQEFRNPKVFYPDPKNIDLDRVLINLFIWLKCNGERPVTRGRVRSDFEKVDVHVDNLAKYPGVEGFERDKWIAQRWLETDIFDLVNRGRPGAEAIASLRPLHLDAHKIRVAKHCRDYNHADALYAMLEHGEPQAVKDLKTYLEHGRDNATGKYDGKTRLDLETLTVLKLVEGIPDLSSSGEKISRDPPTCKGQSRLLGDDVQRLLAYRDVIPRPVMVDYLKTILGLHLALYTFRVGKQLSGWVREQKSNPTCAPTACPVYGGADAPFKDCPYSLKFVVDMGGTTARAWPSLPKRAPRTPTAGCSASFARCSR